MLQITGWETSLALYTTGSKITLESFAMRLGFIVWILSRYLQVLLILLENAQVILVARLIIVFFKHRSALMVTESIVSLLKTTKNRLLIFQLLLERAWWQQGLTSGLFCRVIDLSRHHFPSLIGRDWSLTCLMFIRVPFSMETTFSQFWRWISLDRWF